MGALAARHGTPCLVRSFTGSWHVLLAENDRHLWALHEGIGIANVSRHWTITVRNSGRYLKCYASVAY